MWSLQRHSGSVVTEDAFSNIHRQKAGFMAENIAGTSSTLAALATDKAVKVSKHPHRLSAVARDNQMQKTGVDTSIKQNRQAQLDTYEAPHNLPIPAFAKLAGKSRDQINREIASGQLLAISLDRKSVV